MRLGPYPSDRRSANGRVTALVLCAVRAVVPWPGGEYRPISTGRYGIADALIEAPIVTSSTRVGYEVRRRLAGWTPLDVYDLTGRVIVITGATSGLGYAAADQLARCGATLAIVGRTAERSERAVAELTAATGNRLITHEAADVGRHPQRDEGRARRRLRHHLPCTRAGPAPSASTSGS